MEGSTVRLILTKFYSEYTIVIKEALLFKVYNYNNILNLNRAEKEEQLICQVINLIYVKCLVEQCTTKCNFNSVVKRPANARKCQCVTQQC